MDAVEHAAEYRDLAALQAPYERVIDEGDRPVYASINTLWMSTAQSAWWLTRHGFPPGEAWYTQQLDRS